jgi:PAS domain S-box-containing protein
VEVARDAIIGLSRDGIITSLNPAFETITGRGCSEWVDKELADILHPDDVDSATEILKSVQEGEMPAPSELRLRSKSGKYVIAEVTATPIIKGGTVVGISVIARDVTDRKRAEEAMKESDEYFRSLLGDISEGVTVLNADGTIRYQSPSAEKLFGYNADEHLGKIAWDFVHPDDASAVLGALEGLMREPGATMSMECRYRSADGSWRNMECSARNCVDDPVIQGIIVNSRDVTDQSRAEEALARSESYYRSLIENVSESIHIVNGDGTIRYVAPSSERVNGYRPEELVGEDGFKFLHPDDVPKAVSLLSEIKKKPNATVSVEVRFCHKDGSVHYVEAVGVNRLDDPAVGGIVVNSRDVTERRQLTEKLEHGEEYYRSLVENNAADVTIINANGTIQYKSPTAERAYGFEPSQMISKNAFEFVHPDDLTRVTHTLDDLMHNPGATETIECRQRLKGAIWRYIEITATNLLNNPAVAGIVLNQRDITEYRETEKRLKESEMRMKDLLENLQTSQEELSTPVVQIWDHILALPLVGVIDTHRAKQVMDVLLTKITELRAQVVVIDVTGVATMDTQVTNHLIQTAQSTRLLGAECVITGIKPEVAQTMVHIGADMTKLITKRDLQEGLRYGLTLIGYGFREEHVETVEQG